MGELSEGVLRNSPSLCPEFFFSQGDSSQRQEGVEASYKTKFNLSFFFYDSVEVESFASRRRKIK